MSRRRRPRDLGRQRPHAYTRRRCRLTASMSTSSARTRRCRVRSATIRASPSIGYPRRPRHGAPSLSYAPVALVDAARISFRLWTTLRRLPRPDLVLVQNPPAFPTLMVTHFTLVRRGVRFVIDWHNIGYTLLRLRLGQWHPAVRFARWLERHDARKADASLCVSRGLADFLKTRFGLDNKCRSRSLFRKQSALSTIKLLRLGIHAAVVGIHHPPDELDGRRTSTWSSTRSGARRIGFAAGDGESAARFPNLILVTATAEADGVERRLAVARRRVPCAPVLEPEDYLRSWAAPICLVPAPFVVRARHSDEGGRLFGAVAGVRSITGVAADVCGMAPTACCF